MGEHERINKKATVFSIGTIIAIVLLAALVAGIWYFFRGRKTERSKETPRISGVWFFVSGDSFAPSFTPLRRQFEELTIAEL